MTMCMEVRSNTLVETALAYFRAAGRCSESATELQEPGASEALVGSLPTEVLLPTYRLPMNGITSASSHPSIDH